MGSAVPVVEMADLKNLQGFCGGFDTAALLKVKSMTRTITTHEVNGLNESLLIAVLADGLGITQQ